MSVEASARRGERVGFERCAYLNDVMSQSHHLGLGPNESASPHSSTRSTRFDGRVDPCANARIAAVELHGGGDVLAFLGSDATRYVSGTNQVDYSASMTRHCCQVSGGRRALHLSLLRHPAK